MEGIFLWFWSRRIVDETEHTKWWKENDNKWFWKACFIVMLSRNVLLVHSHHKRFVFRGTERTERNVLAHYLARLKVLIKKMSYLDQIKPRTNNPQVFTLSCTSTPSNSELVAKKWKQRTTSILRSDEQILQSLTSSAAVWSDRKSS